MMHEYGIFFKIEASHEQYNEISIVRMQPNCFDYLVTKERQSTTGLLNGQGAILPFPTKLLEFC